MKKIKVLIVEDEEDIASILKINLEADGFNVETLSNGNDVFQFVKSNHVDIILLDVMIPDKDGFEVCRELKANVETKSVPIIFLTAKTLEHNVISGLELGADDYITKPFSISVIISRIKAVLRRSSKQVESTDENKLKVGDITLDKIKMTVKTSDGKLSLNTTVLKNEGN